MKVEAADPKVSGELLFPPADGIIGIVIRFESRLPRSMTLLAANKRKVKKKERGGKRHVSGGCEIVDVRCRDLVICNRQL